MSNEELVALISQPREALDIEIKEWLDLATNEHRAKLAKEMIALANHGGGRVLLGLAETPNGFAPAGQSPYPMASYGQDAIQSIVSKYIDPPFQCHVSLIDHGGSRYPVIQVPGGHRVPVRAKAGSPDQKDLVAGRTYVRRPGPNSEEPRTNEDWDAIFGRCIRNRKDELLDSLRAVLEGLPPKMPPEPTPQEELAKLVQIDRERWRSRVSKVPKGETPWLPKGYFDLAFQLDPPTSSIPLLDLRNLVRQEVKNHSGWPPFVTIDRDPHSPKVVDGAVEFWFGPEKDGTVDTADHHQFWRVSPQGHFFVRSGYPEDGGRGGVTPGTVLDITSPTWRLAETLIEVHAMGIAMGGRDSTMHYIGEWTGLRGRKLTSISGRRMLHDGYRALQSDYRAAGSIPLVQLIDLLPELVYAILAPMYELFDMKLPKQLVVEEIVKLTQRTF